MSTLFTGDPLKFKDKATIFSNVNRQEKHPKAQKTVPRKVLKWQIKLLGVFFLLGTEAAYDSAWQLWQKNKL